MIERNVELATLDGRMPCFVVHPDEDGPFPVVLVYMDALGIREELRDMARRFASAGYFAMLPNLYYRDGGPSFDASGLSSGILDPLMMALNGALSMAMTASDTKAMLEFASSDANAGTSAAAVGYCMGGRHALSAAAAFPARISCYASLHGGRLVTADAVSPHLLIERTDAEAYFGWAHNDPVAPLDHAATIEAALVSRGRRFRIEHHKDAEHGFTFPERYCYQKEAAERVWARLFALFRRNLKRTNP